LDEIQTEHMPLIKSVKQFFSFLKNCDLYCNTTYVVTSLSITANSAAYASAILYFLTYIPFSFLNSRYSDMTTSQKLGACLLNNVAMSFGVLTIALYEATGLP